jgi:hypothetical protein
MSALALVVSLVAVLGTAQGTGRAAPGTTLLTVRPGHAAWLHVRPGGARVARLGAATEFASPTVLAVLGWRGAWARISHPAVANRTAWVRVGPALRRDRTRYSVRVDLSARRATVRLGPRVRRRIAVAVGAPGSPTPTGTFQITDRLDGPRFSPAYGCCILALSARQTHPPPGWSGGDRIALHGSPAPRPGGRAVTAGCLRADDVDMRWLMAHLPVGTPVRIRR